MGILYLCQLPELRGTNRFKIGYTNASIEPQNNSKYFCKVDTCDVLNLCNSVRKHFNAKFKLITGRNHFEGNREEMKEEFVKHAMKFRNPKMKIISFE